MKKSKKNPHRFCEDCVSIVGNVPDDMKVIQCMGCRKPVYVAILNTKTCRCEECQSKADEESNRMRQQRWYDTHVKPNASLQNLNTTK